MSEVDSDEEFYQDRQRRCLRSTTRHRYAEWRAAYSQFRLAKRLNDTFSAFKKWAVQWARKHPNSRGSSVAKFLCAVKSYHKLQNNYEHWSLKEPERIHRPGWSNFVKGLQRTPEGRKKPPSRVVGPIMKEQLLRIKETAGKEGKELLVYRAIELTWWAALRPGEAPTLSLYRISKSSDGTLAIHYLGNEVTNKTHWEGIVFIRSNLQWLRAKATPIQQEPNKGTKETFLFPGVTSADISALVKKAATAFPETFPPIYSWSAQSLRKGRAMQLKMEGKRLEDIQMDLKHVRGSRVTAFHYLGEKRR